VELWGGLRLVSLQNNFQLMQLLRSISKLKKVFLISTLLFLGVLFFLLTRVPSHDRNWTDDHSVLPQAQVSDDVVTLYNVRDWQYGTEEPTNKEWLKEVTLNPREITAVWFVLEPFAKFKAVGHSFLSFEFENGEAYSFSVEARREVGEDYSSVAGIFPQYELIYAWGTERDFITRRLVMLDHPVHFYKLELSPEDSAGLLKTLARATEDLAATPRFYNTLTANCTNMLAKIINAKYLGRVPYDISWNMPGFSDSFLFKQGLITSDSTFEHIRESSLLTPYKNEIVEAGLQSTFQFSRKLREVVTQ